MITARPSNKKILFVFILYVAVVFVFFEGATRLFFSSEIILERIKGEDDATRRLIWIKQHQGRAVNRYAFDIYDALRGWALKPDIRNMIMPGGNILNSNSRGIRGVTEYRYGKPHNKTRILILGDSFAFGEEVSDHETFPHYLQHILPHSEVINFGVHGYGHDQMLIFLKEEGVKFAPDIVILGFVHGDMRRNLLKFRDYAKPKYELAHNKVILTNIPVPSPESFLRQEIYRSKFYDLLTILYSRMLLHSAAEKEKMEEITTAILDEMIKTIKNIGAVPVFAYLPYNEELENTGEHITDKEKYFFDLCSKKNIGCVSLRPYFVENARKGVVFKKTGHWDAKGNQIVAEGLGAYLLKNFLTYPK